MTDRYAVLGNPIGHSKSPFIHSSFAALVGHDISYVAIEAPLDGFGGVAERFRAADGRGINITAPFKLEAFGMATQAGTGAQLAGAANTLKFEGDQILAENFDGVALIHDIEANLAVPIAGRRVLLMGAGGAARGVMLPLLERHPSRLVVVNRTLSKLERFTSQFSRFGQFTTSGYADLDGMAFDIVINATSTSIQHERLPIGGGIFAGGSLAYDLGYGQGLSWFLGLARSAGAGCVVDGVGMLVEQAAEAFAWWRGVRPETATVIDALRVPLV